MGKVLSVAAQHLLAHFLHLIRGPPAIAHPQPASIINVPTDVLHTILDFLLAMFTENQLGYRTYFWDEEPSCGARLIPLSGTCRYLREQTRPRIFREVSNWSKGAPRADVWPDALWPFIVEVTLRDRSVRHPNPIALSANVLAAIPLMPSLNKVILHLEIPVPAQLLLALSLAPQLSSLEILQARLDCPLPPLAPLPFPSLQNLILCVWKFTAVVTTRDVVPEVERENVAVILRSVCDRLTTLNISGDLLSSKFLPIHWPHLRKFTVTEHTPTPFLTVSDVTAQMPALQELAVLYSADLSRPAGELRPPFTLGVPGGRLLTEGSPRLTSVTLANLKPDDPVFRQLPSTLEALHVVATWDLYIPEPSAPKQTQESPLTPLVELTLTLDHFPTPDLIKIVSDAFPYLRFLELGNSRYRSADELVEDVRDFAHVESLSRLTSLSRLRISLYFWEREPTHVQRAVNQNAAGWFLIHLPTLKSISFSYQRWSSWTPFFELERTTWATYLRTDFPVGWEPPVSRPHVPNESDEVIIIPPRIPIGY
ncbi:hypothetical protein B0H16DRAFT_1902176 [Mycena metata]|uniref:Uncharacterized protein n=1 Tax=Mycena metata TaxID=1033252 RepID=A0AAD7GRS0_9AGAR|nr:hypothetical protein B0H16DRAFT_1902176 [Mycena metata]